MPFVARHKKSYKEKCRYKFPSPFANSISGQTKPLFTGRPLFITNIVFVQFIQAPFYEHWVPFINCRSLFVNFRAWFWLDLSSFLFVCLFLFLSSISFLPLSLLLSFSSILHMKVNIKNKSRKVRRKRKSEMREGEISREGMVFK